MTTLAQAIEKCRAFCPENCDGAPDGGHAAGCSDVQEIRLLLDHAERAADAARQVERMRPVVEAAEKWNPTVRAVDGTKHLIPEAQALVDALDAYSKG